MTTDSHGEPLENASGKSTGFARLGLLLTLVLVAVYAWRPIGPGYDFWAHAAVGRWIVDSGQVPRHTLFLWSVQPPYPWVAHSWLSEVIFYGLLSGSNRLLGKDANAQDGATFVVALMTMITMAVFYLLWRLWQRRAPGNLFAPLVFAVAIWSAAPRFQPRQETLSALLLTLLFLFLIQWHDASRDASTHQKRTRLLAIIIILMFALWVNLHALCILGLVFLFLTAGGDWLQHRKNPELQKRALRLGGVGLLSFGATLINPWGIGVWAAADQLRPGNMSRLIEEWQPPLYSSPEVGSLAAYVVAEAIIVLVAFVAWLRNPNRRWSELGWLLLMSILLLRQRRHLWLLAIVALVVAGNNARYLSAPGAWNWWRKVSKQPVEPPAKGMRIMARGGVLFCLGFGTLLAALTKIDELVPLRGVSPKAPEAAVQFVEKNNLRGRMFNDYENSSYLQWRFNGPQNNRVLASGRRPLYIDLLNAYEDGPQGLMAKYVKALNDENHGRELLREQQVDYVVLGSHRTKYPLAKYLNQNADWTRVFQDQNATIWVRRGSQSRTNF